MRAARTKSVTSSGVTVTIQTRAAASQSAGCRTSSLSTQHTGTSAPIVISKERMRSCTPASTAFQAVRSRAKTSTSMPIRRTHVGITMPTGVTSPPIIMPNCMASWLLMRPFSCAAVTRRVGRVSRSAAFRLTAPGSRLLPSTYRPSCSPREKVSASSPSSSRARVSSLRWERSTNVTRSSRAASAASPSGLPVRGPVVTVAVRTSSRPASTAALSADSMAASASVSTPQSTR